MTFRGIIHAIVVNHRKAVVCLSLYGLSTWAISLILPLLAGFFVDSMMNYGKTTTMNNVVVSLSLLSGMWVFQIIIYYFSGMLHFNTKIMSVNDLYSQFYDKLTKVDYGNLINNDMVHLNQTSNYDTREVCEFIFTHMFSIFFDAMSFVMILSILYFKTSLISVVVVMFISPIYMMVYRNLRHKVYVCTQDATGKEAELITKKNKYFEKLKDIILQNWINKVKSEYEVLFSKTYSSAYRQAKISFLLQISTQVLRVLVMLTLYVYAAYEVTQGTMSIGDFTSLSILLSSLIDSATNFVNFGQHYQRARVSLDRLNNVLLLPEREGVKPVPQSITEISVSELCYSYGDGSIIKNFSYTFHKGKLYCLKGPNGSGKSTLLTILSGITENYGGSILVSGIELKKLNYTEYRKYLGFVEQEPASIFPDSLSIINERCDPVMLDKITSFLMGDWDKIPDCIDTNLSLGERQRISITRVLSRKTPVILMDEPTASLDTRSVMLLFDLLRMIKKDAIIIVVSHDTKLLDYSDEIIEIT